MDLKTVIKKNYKQLNTYKFNNLDEMGKFASNFLNISNECGI